MFRNGLVKRLSVESASRLRLGCFLQIGPARGQVELAVAAVVKEDESPHRCEHLPHEFLELFIVVGIVLGPDELARDFKGQVGALPRRQKDRVAQADPLFLAKASVRLQPAHNHHARAIGQAVIDVRHIAQIVGEDERGPGFVHFAELRGHVHGPDPAAIPVFQSLLRLPRERCSAKRPECQ